MSVLLTRDDFRSEVFQRDSFLCVVPECNRPAVDAHHIIERRLWTDSSERLGYFLENGASLCGKHHQFGAETCSIQPQVLRRWLNLPVRLPKEWDREKSYDKWGNALKRPTRHHIKYPSTPYLHISPGYDVNDINLPDLKSFLNVPLVVTIKMDGSNAQLRYDAVAARNGAHADHHSFDMLKSQFVNIQALIPKNIQIFGEWLYAKHSIHYTDQLSLQSLFQVFSVYDADACMFLGWDEVRQWASTLGFPTVPVVMESEFKTEWELEAALTRLSNEVISEGHEGIVVRSKWPFPYGMFEGYETSNGKTTWKVAPVGKYVRANHVQTADHWSQQPLTRNETII